MYEVSVIIPTYNCTEYISNAINSVLSQTYKNYEIIVIDDGSTDNTKDKLIPFISEEKIKYFYIKNSGPAKARNVGIKKSKGDYIAFLDSDDLWLPDKLMLQIDFLDRSSDIEVVHCDLEFFNKDKILHDVINKDKLILDGLIFNDCLLLRSLVFLSSLLVKRSILDTVGLFDESLYTAEDVNLILRIAKKHKFGYINKVLLKRRIHENNLSQKWIENYGTFDNLDKIVKLYPELNPSHSKLMRRAYEIRYKCIGKTSFYISKYIKARQLFMHALRINCLNVHTIGFLILTFVPGKCLDYLRNLKRNSFKYIKINFSFKK